MEFLVPVIIALVAGAGAGVGGFYIYNKRNENGGKNKADELIRKAKHEASEIVLNAKKEATDINDKALREEADRRKEWKKTENRLADRETLLDTKLDQIDKKSENLRKQETEIEELKDEVRAIRTKAQEKLEKIAGLSKADAKDKLMAMTERDIKDDLKNLVIKEQKAYNDHIDETAEAMLLTAMERMSSEVTADRTITSLKLPDDDMKGRIIGKEGRNIQALQHATGVDVLVDDTPGMVVLSSFDPIRRQVARYALERLMKDGRINPSSIEDAVAKAEREIEKEVVRAGEDAAREVGVIGIPSEILHLLGELKFRTSYGQNLLQHSIETAKLCATMAAELGLNVKAAKRAGLLHDIGKVAENEEELPHAILGMKVAERLKEKPDICNAIGAHHEEIEMDNMISPIVQVCDAISGARPGARREVVEAYIQRLNKLEEMAMSYPGVVKTYAIQAGRELRVIVGADKVTDQDADRIAYDLSKQIQTEMTYPGQIKITVIRETRAVNYAR